MSIRMLIVDNQPMVRRGLTLFLSTDSAIEILGEADNGNSALTLAQDLRPDLMLMDLLMPGMDGIEATRAIRQQQPDVHIIALSSSSDSSTIAAALLAGAASYLHKSRKPDLLMATIKGVMAGRVMLLPNVMHRVLDELPLPNNQPQFSTDDLGLLALLSEGFSDVEMAEQSGLELATLQQRLLDMQISLDSPTRLLLVLRAMQLGLVKRPVPG